MPPVSTPSDGVMWFDLFDLANAEHICDAIRVTILNRVEAEAPTGWQAENLRRFVLAPLDSYMAEHFNGGASGIQLHIEKAQALYDKAERIAELFADEYPFFAEEASMWRELLWMAWLEFVAYGSAHRIYWDLPRQKEQAKRAAGRPRGGGKAIDVQAVVSYMRDRQLLSLSDEQAEELAALYPGEDGKQASISTIRRRVSDARKRRFLPPK